MTDPIGLGAFLRARRERLTPDPGAAVRRRTPGLRREEIADRAGISATWYTRLEQGRDVAASPAALARLATALRLTRAERAHLFELAGRHDPVVAPVTALVPPDLARSVAALTAPAYLLDAAWSARAWNAAAADLFAGWLGGAEANLLRYVFLDPAARRFIVDWPLRAARLQAEFRIDHARRLHVPEVVALVDGLCRDSAEFDQGWQGQRVLGREGGHRAFDHPAHGRLDFDQVTFVPAAEPDYKLVMLLPLSDRGSRQSAP